MAIDRAFIIDLVRKDTARALKNEKDARLKLAEILAGDNPIDSFQVKHVLTAQANARPWQLLARLIEREGDEVTALGKAREHFTRELIENAAKHSTCPVSNVMDTVRRDGIRNFLRITDF